MAAGTPLPVPAALLRGVELRVIDYDELELSVTAGAAGTGTASTDYLPQGQWLRVERIVVCPRAANSQQDAELAVYQGDQVLIQRTRDWTPLPAGYAAVAEYPSYLTILPGSCLTAGISGATPGDAWHISVQYQLVTKARA